MSAGIPILPEGVELEFVFPVADDPECRAYDHFLSGPERIRRDGFKSARRRATFAMGRVAARRLLARRLGCLPPDVPLHVADDGAVEVVGTSVFLSISHTDEGAVAVVGPMPVGIDVEPSHRRIGDLSEYVLNPAERDAMVAESDPDGFVLRSWVAKESVLKGLRSGLRVSPGRVTLRFEGNRGVARRDDGVDWRFALGEHRGLIVAVAYPGKGAV